jgi:hypothetical protein
MSALLDDLDGTNFARVDITAEGVTLVLMSPAGFSEVSYYPAESFTLTSLEAIERLQDLIERALAALAEQQGEETEDRPPLPTGAFKL